MSLPFIPKYNRIINQSLIQAVIDGKCILFVGAGLSMQTMRPSGKPLPSWGQLLDEMLVWAKSQNIRFWGEADDIKSMIDKGNLLMAAQELQERIPPADLNMFLRQVFHGVQPAPVHRLLPLIKFRSILTTNYDSLIESAYVLVGSGTMPYCFTQEDLLHIGSPLRTDEFFIFKIHGHISNQSTIMLGSRNYQELFFRTPGYRQFLETLFSVYTVLFVGFSGNDPDLDMMLERLATIYSRTLGKHFILLPEKRMNDTEKRRLSLDKKLEVIEYSQMLDNDHSQVEAFLRELRAMVDARVAQPTQVRSVSVGLNIFISAARWNSSMAQRIATRLRQKNYRVFWFSEQLPGANILQNISQALDSADCVIVLYSPEAANSDFVSSEIQIALSNEMRGKSTLIPILLGSVEPPSAFQGRYYLKFSDEMSENDLILLSQMLEEIEQNLVAKRSLRFTSIPHNVLENRVSNLMGRFSGQSVPGELFGLVNRLIELPTFSDILPADKYENFQADLIGRGNETWLVEIKNIKQGKLTSNDVGAFLAMKNANVSDRLWIVSSSPITTSARSRLVEHGVLLSAIEDIEQLENLLSENSIE